MGLGVVGVPGEERTLEISPFSAITALRRVSTSLGVSPSLGVGLGDLLLVLARASRV